MNLNDPHLGIFLSAAVPLQIEEIQSRRGPTKEDMETMREYAKLLNERGVALLFKSKKKGETTQMANGLARAIATLSFAPGGVTLFGQHWESVAEENI
jgi:hypothetical protein